MLEGGACGHECVHFGLKAPRGTFEMLKTVPARELRKQRLRHTCLPEPQQPVWSVSEALKRNKVWDCKIEGVLSATPYSFSRPAIVDFFNKGKNSPKFAVAGEKRNGKPLDLNVNFADT